MGRALYKRGVLRRDPIVGCHAVQPAPAGLDSAPKADVVVSLPLEEHGRIHFCSSLGGGDCPLASGLVYLTESVVDSGDVGKAFVPRMRYGCAGRGDSAIRLLQRYGAKLCGRGGCNSLCERAYQPMCCSSQPTRSSGVAGWLYHYFINNFHPSL